MLLEAASWNGANIQRSAVRLGLRSEASARFEKGLSAGSTLEAQAIASALLIELCGARLLPGTIDVGGPGAEAPAIALRPARVDALLGAEIPPARCAEILDRARLRRAGRHAAARPRPPPPPPRRHARDRPDRGGRADRRARAAARHAAAAPRRRRPPDPPAASAPARRGRSRRARALGDRRLELHRAAPAGAAADPRGGPDEPRGRAREPDV